MRMNDEINVLDLFARFFRFLKNVFTSAFIFVRKNILLLFLLSALGSAGGYVYYKQARPVYAADLIISSYYLANDFCFELIKGLQNYVEDNTPEILAEKLSISPEAAKKIVRIQYNNFSEKYKSVNDTLVEIGRPFRISVFVLDNSVYAELKPALLNYIEQNPYVVEQKNIRMKNTEALISKIKLEQNALDTLKRTIANHLVPRGTQNGFVFGQPLDPLNIYREGMALYRDELSQATELNMNSKNCRVVRDFEIRQKPYSPLLKTSLSTGALIGFLAGVLLVMIRTWRKKG